MIKAVIFDLDGVLIDSEPLHCMADNQLLKEFGTEAPAKYFDRFTGWTDDAMWEAIKTDYHLTKSISEIKELQVPIKLKLLKDGDYKAISGVVELLERIKERHIPIAIASSSPKRFIEAVVDKIGVRQYFEIMVSGEDVVRSKPEPDIFLKAAGLLNVNPSGCLVVEDSKSGTLAAKKAGMTCIGYQNVNSGNQDLSMADFVVSDINEIDLRKVM
ncbi:MAG: HAD family phosphatase [Bacteroidales bacterium]|nr:HAD family phosphatase [Bacteroidales bacterium]MBK8881345.1 HAD family phosphatase [Bacteroidales bacterium]